MDHLLFLPIDHSVIGDWRAAQVFMACRAYAHHISPGCEILAKYDDHERVGWRFWLNSAKQVEDLLALHGRIMAAATL